MRRVLLSAAVPLRSWPARYASGEAAQKFTPFSWDDAKEAEWIAEHGSMHCDVPEVSKADVMRLFEQRTIADKLLENFVMIDVRGRAEVMNTLRLDVDVDQCYVVPYDEVSDSWNNLSLAQFYSKYIFPKPRKNDTIILYGRDAKDVRPYLAARLLITKHQYTDVRVYKGGFVDFRGMDYEDWVGVVEEKLASSQAAVVQERERLEERRRAELERYRRERLRRDPTSQPA